MLKVAREAQSHNQGGQVVEDYSAYVGLDVHKEMIAVAVAYPGAVGTDVVGEHREHEEGGGEAYRSAVLPLRTERRLGCATRRVLAATRSIDGSRSKTRTA